MPEKDNWVEPKPRRGLYKRKVGKRTDGTDDVLDLHGLTRQEALHKLATYVSRCFVNNIRTILVITGKGLRSKDGESVLRPSVEEWILRNGKRFIESYAEAPRAYGGKGAFIIFLRSE